MNNEVKIRFNTDFLNDKRWRVIRGDTEDLVDEVEIKCKSYTTKDLVKNDVGIKVEKYHITCKPKSVTFSRTKTRIKLILK